MHTSTSGSSPPHKQPALFLNDCQEGSHSVILSWSLFPYGSSGPCPGPACRDSGSGLDPGHALRDLAGEATAQSLDVVPVGTHQLPSHPEGLSWVCAWKEREAIDTPHHHEVWGQAPQSPLGVSVPLTSSGICFGPTRLARPPLFTDEKTGVQRGRRQGQVSDFKASISAHHILKRALCDSLILVCVLLVD